MWLGLLNGYAALLSRNPVSPQHSVIAHSPTRDRCSVLATATAADEQRFFGGPPLRSRCCGDHAATSTKQSAVQMPADGHVPARRDSPERRYLNAQRFVFVSRIK